MILVTGATGTAGSRVVQALRERRARVRAFVRDAEKARQLLGDEVELAVGDFADASSVRAALDGAEAMLLSCADDPRRVEWETNAIDAAAAAGVRRIVKLSTICAAPGAPVAFWDWHGQVEEYLRASGVPGVILRSSFYMSNLLATAEQVAGEGRLYAPAGEARVAMIDPRDVGAAAAAALTGAAEDGQTSVVTGPEAITWGRIAAELSAATGREVEFVDVPDEGARAGLIAAGLPEFVAEQLVTIFGQLRQGVAEQVTDGVYALTGSGPRGFAEFARDHAHLFRPVAAAATQERTRKESECHSKRTRR
jgi:uncharacterized protein YbjT (DUF2867 family)